MQAKKIEVKNLIRAIIQGLALGIVVTLATGFVENKPEIGISEYHFYGYPFIWRITRLAMPDAYIFYNLAIDILFWTAIMTILSIIFNMYVLSRTKGFEES